MSQVSEGPGALTHIFSRVAVPFNLVGPDYRPTTGQNLRPLRDLRFRQSPHLQGSPAACCCRQAAAQSHVRSGDSLRQTVTVDTHSRLMRLGGRISNWTNSHICGNSAPGDSIHLSGGTFRSARAKTAGDIRLHQSSISSLGWMGHVSSLRFTSSIFFPTMLGIHPSRQNRHH